MSAAFDLYLVSAQTQCGKGRNTYIDVNWLLLSQKATLNTKETFSVYRLIVIAKQQYCKNVMIKVIIKERPCRQ